MLKIIAVTMRNGTGIKIVLMIYNAPQNRFLLYKLDQRQSKHSVVRNITRLFNNPAESHRKRHSGNGITIIQKKAYTKDKGLKDQVYYRGMPATQRKTDYTDEPTTFRIFRK